jgi:hypothetical protein
VITRKKKRRDDQKAYAVKELFTVELNSVHNYVCTISIPGNPTDKTNPMVRVPAPCLAHGFGGRSIRVKAYAALDRHCSGLATPGEKTTNHKDAR